MLNQQDLAKNGWDHLKSGWGEVDSACTRAWHKSCKKTLSLKAAFLPVIDDLPAFVLLINGEKSPNPRPPFLSFPSSAFLLFILPPSFQPSLSPPSNSPPFSPFPHSYAFVSFPKSPRSSHPLPPCFKFQVYVAWVHNQNFNTFLEARTGYCCIHIAIE